MRTQTNASPTLEEIILHSDTPIIVKRSFMLSSPPRLAIDLERQSSGSGVGLPPNYQGSVLTSIRFGQFNAETSRLVLDLASAEIEYQIIAEGQKLCISLQRIGQASAPTAAPAPIAATRPAASPSAFPLPQPRPVDTAKQSQKPIIVIDAGHGGKDTGAVGKSGSLEKHITLDYAHALRTALLKTGRYRVVMTRSDDRYLFLKERIAIARKMQGDVFISIHADSNPVQSAKGLSVYTLSEKASDEEAAALATQENKSDVIGGLDLSVEDETVANILIDLAQRETNNKSSRLADTVVASARPQIPLITKPHRNAGFRVLKSPDMPSLLVEIGFLSNPEDERRIQTKAHRERMVQSMIKALDQFFAAK